MAVPSADREPDERPPARALPGLRLTVILGVLLGFASISTDLFLPALPTMSVALGASEGTLQLTISAYLLGFGFGQLFWGPISDRFGRRRPIVLGILVFVIGSAGCGLSTSGWQIIGWRVVQALGASAGVALARAMVRDLYDRDQAAKLLSLLMTVMAVAPLLGPSLGAQILAFTSWRAIFATLVAIGLATMLAVLTLPETLPPERRQSLALKPVLAGYGSLFGNRRFLGYGLALGFYYLGIFANIAGTPSAYISYHHLSPEIYALLFAAGIAGVMITNTANSRLVTRLGTDRMLLVGTGGAALFGVGVALVAATDWGGIWGLFPAVFLFGSMNGLIAANAVAGALSSVRTRAGAASALLGAFQYGSGMVGSALVGLLADGTPLPMSGVMALGGIGSLSSVLLARRLDRAG